MAKEKIKAKKAISETPQKTTSEKVKKITWESIGVIVSLLGVAVSLIFSILSYNQSNIAEKRQERNEERNEKQYLENKNEIEIEKLKTVARDLFTDGEYTKSFEQYQKVSLRDSTDNEGYRRFFKMGNILKSNKKEWQNDSIILIFFERAEQLKPTK